MSQIEKTGKQCESPLEAAKSWAWLSDVAMKYPKVSFVELSQFICPNKQCQAILGDQVVFRDEQHLTSSFVASLYNQVADQF
ncbi:MAG: SGNH hydrolase domain-containing protein [Marinicella sp.]